MGKFNWNPVFNLVMKIKNDYRETFGDLDTDEFEKWLSRLGNEEYNNVFGHLKVKQYNDFIIIRYGMDEMHESMWTDSESIFRECRSVVIDVANEQLVLAPFRKFFNLNEVEENKFESVQNEIKNAKSVEITDKLDGSMQSARYYNGDIFLSGSMALDRNSSWRLSDGYSKLTQNHKDMIVENPEYTFIFEYISVKDAHVVFYSPEDEGMYLIGMRNVFTGKQLAYKDVKSFAEKYDVPMTKIENKDFEDIIKDAKRFKSTEKEGWVLNIDGHMIKLKCDDYVQLHRVLNRFSSVNTIIKNIADGTFDDLISKVPENYLGRINQVAKLIYEYMKNTNKNIEDYYIKAPKQDRKEYMVWVTNNCPKEIQGYLRQKYLNKEYHVLKTCFMNSTKYRKLNEMGLEGTYSALFEDLEEA
ncbi:T4 RnlA family RNA ligase [Acetivibrio cellulolyticus]|uniref:T4 RnlA family RNA ligase n=1 Tax=Acetivibrio cellulolyticus TaxID=35830 RepID=UPI0001E2DE02|nr:T4 RnlA family RNA ligase [Acetivibrio cellulolyticus]